jgi:hypothetical protein
MRGLKKTAAQVLSFGKDLGEARTKLVGISKYLKNIQ